jgi:hypothetical protein
MVRNGKECKTPNFLWWLQLSKGKYLTFCREFAMRRSATDIACMDELVIIFRVANLWTEFPARDVYATGADGKECKNPRKSSVAATFEKANTYVFAEPLVWDREVGGSNPLAPTNHINNLRLPALAAVSLVWPICDQHSENALVSAIGRHECTASSSSDPCGPSDSLL